MPIKTHPMPPVEILRRYFRIDQHWRLERWTPTHGWRLAARIRPGCKYPQVGFEGKQFFAHRIIWTIHHGRAPDGLIDHINGKPWDNRIENLREATSAQNRWNAEIRSKSNRTGYKNVQQTPNGFRARVCADYEAHYSPEFDDPELAELAAVALAERVHGEFAHSRRAA